MDAKMYTKKDTGLYVIFFFFFVICSSEIRILEKQIYFLLLDFMLT